MERVWDTASTNWSWGSATVAFFSGDVVRLDDTVNPAYRSVLLSSPIISSLIAVDTASEYQFGGDGKLTGATTLTKTGNGKLVITNAGINDFGGQLNIAGGSVELGAGDILGTLGAGLINISNAASLALNRSDDITVANTLTGTGVLEKRGTNVLTLSGTSLNYAGTVLVSSGTLKAGNINAFGGTNVGGTTIASGATLDVNALRLTNEAFIASGPGVNGQGAIINSTNTGQNNALRMLTLAGDVTFGGVGRWDVRSTDLTNMPAYLSTGSNAYNITKVGTNQVTLVSVNVDPAQYNVNINEGGFGYESFSSFGDPAGTVTVASNAYFWLHNLSNAFTKLMVFQGGASFINNAGANTIGSLVTLNGDATMDTRGTSSLTFSNTISGLGGLLKTNSGTLVLAAPNTYQGPTTIRGGTLDISAETALGPNPATYQPAWLTLDGTILKASASFDLDDPNRGVFADVGGVTFNTLSNGTLRVLNVISGPGSVKKATAGGTLVLGESNTFTGPMYFGPGALQGTVIVSRVVNSLLPSSIGMSSLDASNLVLAGAVFRYVGPRTESDRLFTVDTGVGNALLDASGTGALRFTNTLPAFVSAAAGVRNWHISGTNMDDNLIAPSISDTAISNATVIWKDGPGRWILAGTNRYTGKTQITGGTLQIDDEIRLGANPPTNFVADQLTFDGGYLRITANMAFDDLNRGTTVTTNGGGFDVDTNVTVAVTRPITGAGSLSKIGAGTLVLSNTHTFASNTLVNAGTMLVQGILDIRTAPVTVNDTGTLGGNGTIERPVVVNAGGILSPGNSVGTLTVNNSVTLNAGSTNYMEIDKTNPQSNDVITATSFNLGGTLVVRITGGSVQVDDVFKLFNGSLNGLFTAVDLPVLSGGLGWDQSRLQVDGTLKVVAGGAAPTWVLQPINTTINYGSNVILTVLANGTPEPAYYWFKSGNASPISVTSNLVLNAVKLSDAGNYFAVASNSVAAIISTTNTVTVLYQLPAPMVGLSSNTFGFEIQAETNRAYWLESRTSLISGSWVVISGITNASGATNLLDAAAVETNKFYRIGTQPSN
jgi:autotransporter-associated beta strand protein